VIYDPNVPFCSLPKREIGSAAAGRQAKEKKNRLERRTTERIKRGKSYTIKIKIK